MKNFVTLQEINEIYCVSRKLVRDILRHYNVDFYKQDDEISAYLLSDSIYPNLALAACSAANAKGHMPRNS